MKQYDMILDSVFSSIDYRAKGLAVKNTDSFVICINGNYYLVTIMAIADYDDDNVRCEYSIFSISSMRYIEKNSEEYKSILNIFPSLDGVDINSDKIGFAQKRMLTNKLYDIVEKLCKDKEITKGVLEEYKEYLAEIQGFKSETLKYIYQFFMEGVDNGIIF